MVHAKGFPTEGFVSPRRNDGARATARTGAAVTNKDLTPLLRALASRLLGWPKVECQRINLTARGARHHFSTMASIERIGVAAPGGGQVLLGAGAVPSRRKGAVGQPAWVMPALYRHRGQRPWSGDHASRHEVVSAFRAWFGARDWRTAVPEHEAPAMPPCAFMIPEHPDGNLTSDIDDSSDDDDVEGLGAQREQALQAPGR